MFRARWCPASILLIIAVLFASSFAVSGVVAGGRCARAPGPTAAVASCNDYTSSSACGSAAGCSWSGLNNDCDRSDGSGLYPAWGNDGMCDEPTNCKAGTDDTDCGRFPCNGVPECISVDWTDRQGRDCVSYAHDLALCSSNADAPQKCCACGGGYVVQQYQTASQSTNTDTLDGCLAENGRGLGATDDDSRNGVISLLSGLGMCSVAECQSKNNVELLQMCPHGKTRALAGHNVDCNGAPMTGIYLTVVPCAGETCTSYEFECLGGVWAKRNSAVNMTTSVEDYGNGNIMTLKHLNVDCGDRAAISQFRFKVYGGSAAKIRYDYQCLPVPIMVNCSNQTAAVWFEDGADRISVSPLDTLDMKCPGSKVLTQFKLDSHRGACPQAPDGSRCCCAGTFFLSTDKFGGHADAGLFSDSTGNFQVLTSRNNAYEAVMQSDGNFVLYRQSDGAALWDANSNCQYDCIGAGSAPWRWVLQGDGNIVRYSNGVATWSSGTYSSDHRPFRLVMQNDGNLVLYNNADSAVWNSGTNEGAADSDDVTLSKGTCGTCAGGSGSSAGNSGHEISYQYTCCSIVTGCPPGFTRNPATGLCRKCPINTYKNWTGCEACIDCDTPFEFAGRGATACRNQCEVSDLANACLCKDSTAIANWRGPDGHGCRDCDANAPPCCCYYFHYY